MKTFIKSKGALVLGVCLLLAVAAILIVRMFGPSGAAFRERADAYFGEGKHDEARIEYMNALRHDPNDAQVHAQLGRIWLKQGLPLRAAPHLAEAHRLDPSSLKTEEYLELATVYLAYGKVPEAQRVALDVLASDPKSMEALSFLVAIASSEEQLQQVEEQLESARDEKPPGFSLVEAMIEARKGDQQGFALAVQRAVIEEPESAAAHMAKARWHEAQSEWEEAREHYGEASKHAERRSGERLALAQYLLRRGDAEGAASEVADVREESPDYTPALALSAQLALRQNDYEEGLQTVQRVLRRDPSNIEARFTQAELLLAQDKPDEALTNLNALRKSVPRSPRVHQLLARAHMAKEDYDQASLAIDAVVETQPENAEALLMQAELNLRRSNPLAAIRALEPVVQKNPNLQRARRLLNDAYRAAGQFEALEASLRDQVADGGGSFADYIQLGNALRQQNKLEEARSAYTKAQAIDPQNPAAVFNLSEVDLLAEDVPSALQRIEELIATSPDLAPAYMMKARIQGIAENWDEAEAAALEALERDPELSAAHDLLVLIYSATGKVQEALDSLESSVAANPDNVNTRYRLALLSGKAEDYDKAIGAYERILALQADHLPSLNNLAVLHAQQRGDLAKAEEYAQRAYTLQPDNAEVADTLGWILFQRGAYQRALALVEQAERALPDNPEVLYHLGMARAMMGELEPARMALERATASDSDFPGKTEAVAQLDRLTSSSSVAVLEERLREQPDDLVARLQLASAYEQQEDFEKAAGAYEAALEANSNLASAAKALARLYAGPLANAEQALVYGTKARELAPGDLEVSAILGRLAWQAGDHQRAYDLLRQTSRQASPSREVWHDLAWAAYSLGRVSEARDYMQRLIDAEPDPEQQAAAERFLSLTDTGGTSGATDVEDILAADPGYVPALMMRAATAPPEQARKDYETVLGRFPNFAPAQAGLAAVLWDGDAAALDRAYQLASKAREAMPSDPEVARILGIITYLRGNPSYARQLLEESGRSGELDPVSLYYLGMAQIDSRDRVTGKATLEKALEGGLAEPLASRAREAVADESGE